ncbi:MAG: ATP-binding domain-containing protein, partial [Actinomycetota bacterium]|nr:ATP-binding domain-containing protein [Actinomycetota bacterium]
LCLRNHPRLGVLNGTRGTVTDVDRSDRALTFVRDDTGQRVDLPADYLDAGWVDHGYALTAHKAQGLTCDATFVLGSDEIYREWGYVALSRGRLTNRLYLLGEPETDEPDDPTHPEALEPDDRTPAEVLAAHLKRSHQQALALDHGGPVAATPVPSSSPTRPDGPVAMTGWLERAIGPCPGDPEGAQVWRQAVTQVEDFRQLHGVADTDRPLGTPPDDPASREAYQQALRQLIEARRQLAPPVPDHRALTTERGLELA